MQQLGRYDVVVAGAGVSGIVAAVAAAREGAATLLVEGSGLLGGLITGGRLTKPQGVIQPGVYLDLMHRAAAYGGADPRIRATKVGSYSGIFDAEVMQRVVIEVVEQSGVDTLLYAHVTDVVRDGDTVTGLVVHTKSGPGLVLAGCCVDATGDGDVATLAGAEFMFGRPSDGRVQPMTSYFRMLNVDMERLVADCLAHRDDMLDVLVPAAAGGDGGEAPELVFFARGFAGRVERARREGFDWILPKNYLTVKAGMLPGEINVNASRVHGNALDPWERSRAALEVRKQAYCVFDFLRSYVGGCEQAVMLDVAPVLGVRETRRVRGRHVLTGAEVRGQARFDDAIGLCLSAIDIHDPAGEQGVIAGVGDGYGIPLRCLLPDGVGGLLTAGRCISVDAEAFGSTRNTPACGLTGQAAGVAAARAAAAGVSPHELDVRVVQDSLERIGVVLGTDGDDGFDRVLSAVEAAGRT